MGGYPTRRPRGRLFSLSRLPARFLADVLDDRRQARGGRIEMDDVIDLGLTIRGSHV